MAGEPGKRVWITYGIVDDAGDIRYVGNTQYDLESRFYEHIFAARSDPSKGKRKSRWHRWLKEQLDSRRSLSIVEISVDNLDWMAREKERAVIAGLEAAGADLLNTHERGRTRCRRCGHLDYPRRHFCAEVTAARVIYETPS